MKRAFKLFTIVFISFSYHLFAQDYTTFEIKDLEPETARKAVNQAFKDLNLPSMHVWKNQTSAKSKFYNYNSLLVKNRFIFKVDIEPDKLTVSIINRQYYANNQWLDSPLPMSKKKYLKF